MRDFAENYSTIFPMSGALPVFVQDHLGCGRKLLDLGCGTGELCHALSSEGVDCLGVDLDPDMIRVAKAREGASRFRQMNMADVGDLDEKFEMVVCLGNVISHLDRAALQQVAEGVFSALGPGGRWIVQLVNWDLWLCKGEDAFPVIERDGGAIRVLREYRGDTERVEFIIRLEIEGKENQESSSSMHPISIPDHIAVNGAAGFALSSQFSGWDRSGFDSGQDRSAVLVFEKG